MRGAYGARAITREREGPTTPKEAQRTHEFQEIFGILGGVDCEPTHPCNKLPTGELERAPKLGDESCDKQTTDVGVVKKN